jgi:septal ring factor EnvC (AmiA/AmiB activator)|tara:strand:- start:937 stop:1407 length:471 start_codon:yes stop_codon:yes gene_type:complete
MSKDTDKDIAELMVQCESALNEYSERTGAPVFAEANTPRTAKSAKKPKPVSEQALVKMTKSLTTACADSEDHITKLDAKLTVKADTLSDLKRQREASLQQEEHARQVQLTIKRKALYRNREPEPVSGSGSGSNSDSVVRHRSVVFGKSSPNLRRPR